MMIHKPPKLHEYSGFNLILARLSVVHLAESPPLQCYRYQGSSVHPFSSQYLPYVRCNSLALLYNALVDMMVVLVCGALITSHDSCRS